MGCHGPPVTEVPFKQKKTRGDVGSGLNVAMFSPTLPSRECSLLSQSLC